MNTFDNTFRITDMLYVLCGLIAIIATVSSLNLQIILRSREWSLLWSIGLSHATLLRRFSFWSALLAFVAAFVSVFGGLVLASVLVYAVNFYSFGYSLTLKIPIELPVIVLTVATICGFLSGRMQAYSLIKNISLKTLNRE
jgi:putative ABC transport system permease protein